ncbi:MAG: hypothetical protein LCH57_00365 [Proteobacteria bacterium]|nr:hypothetical protein [Pseudomonadota bacterium]
MTLEKQPAFQASIGILVTPGENSDQWLEKAHAFRARHAESAVHVSMSVDEALTLQANEWLIVLSTPSSLSAEFSVNQARDLSRLFSHALETGGRCGFAGSCSGDEAMSAVVETFTREVVEPALVAGTWPQELLLFGRQGGSTDISFAMMHVNESRLVAGAPPLTFDMTGRPDVLIWGPHMTLPSGEWRLSVGFEIDKTASTQILRFEWGSLEAYERHDIALDRAGLYDIILDTHWEREAVAEFRISAAHAVFAGTLRILSVAIGRASG